MGQSWSGCPRWDFFQTYDGFFIGLGVFDRGVAIWGTLGKGIVTLFAKIKCWELSKKQPHNREKLFPNWAKSRVVCY